jgi:hypothetical protein
LGQFDIQESTAETDGHLERLVQLFLFEEIAVLGYEYALIAGHPELVEYGVHGAHRLAVGAVYAGNGVNEVLLGVVFSLNAVDRAYLDTGRVFHADAGLSYHEWHIVHLVALPALSVSQLLPSRGIIE